MSESLSVKGAVLALASGEKIAADTWEAGEFVYLAHDGFRDESGLPCAVTFLGEGVTEFTKTKRIRMSETLHAMGAVFTIVGIFMNLIFNKLEQAYFTVLVACSLLNIAFLLKEVYK